MSTYSHSKLGTFLQCPLKYKFQYIDKVLVEIPTTIESFMGDLVHRTLEHLYRVMLEANMIASPESLLMYYNELWMKEWSDDVLIVKKEYTANTYRMLGEHLILGYYEKNKPFNQSRTLGLETQDFLELGDYRYHVRIDRFAEVGDGVYEVHDYKTNARLKSQDDLDEDRQLAMYSLWVKERFRDAKKVKLVWHFLSFNKVMVSERSDEQLELLKNNVAQLIHEIEETKEFVPKVSPLCSWCVFQSICPSFKHQFSLRSKKAEELKLDDGIRLADAYAQLSIAKKNIEDDLVRIREKLIEFAEQFNVDYVYGSNRKISVKQFDAVHIPEEMEVQRLLESFGLLDVFSMVDRQLLVKALREKKLPEGLARELERFILRSRRYRVSVGGRFELQSIGE